MKAKDLKQDKHNYRKHSDRNKQLIRKSIEECGYGRSVVIDADGVLIAGNGVASVTDGKTPVRVIETDGSELVVVKRTDLHEGDIKRKKLAMADNAAGDRVEWDEDNIADDFEQISLEEFDIEIGKNLEKKLDKKGEYESLYEAPLQLLPKKEYILVLCEQEDFDEAREYFGCGFVADIKAGINNAKPVKRSMGWKIWGVNTESSKWSNYEEKPFIFLSYVTASGIVNDGTMFFDEDFKVKEDYEIGLRHIKMFGGVVKARHFYWENEHWTTEGGCKDYRNDAMERECINRLIKKYPQFVKKVERNNSAYCIKLFFD